MCEVPRIDWMSGDPTSALISGSVTSRFEQLRAARPLHVDDDLRIGDVGNGVERRGADRVDAERATPAATSSQTTARQRMTARMMAVIIAHRTLAGALQLVLGVDEEAAEGDDLVAVLQAVERPGVELALDAGLDLLRRRTARRCCWT